MQLTRRYTIVIEPILGSDNNNLCVEHDTYNLQSWNLPAAVPMDIMMKVCAAYIEGLELANREKIRKQNNG